MHTESAICYHYTKTSFFHVFTQILLFLALLTLRGPPTYTTYINLDITTDTINTLRVLWTLKVLINTHHLTSITTLHLNTSALASAQYTILNSTYMCWLYWFFQFSWKYTFWAQKTSILDRQYEKHIFMCKNCISIQYPIETFLQKRVYKRLDVKTQKYQSDFN